MKKIRVLDAKKVGDKLAFFYVFVKVVGNQNNGKLGKYRALQPVPIINLTKDLWIYQKSVNLSLIIVINIIIIYTSLNVTQLLTTFCPFFCLTIPLKDAYEYHHSDEP